jgi:hypothetical protein
MVVLGVEDLSPAQVEQEIPHQHHHHKEILVVLVPPPHIMEVVVVVVLTLRGVLGVMELHRQVALVALVLLFHLRSKIQFQHLVDQLISLYLVVVVVE